LTDVVLSIVFLAETVMTAIGVAIAYKVAELTGKPPIGWIILTVSFGVNLVRSAILLQAYLFTAAFSDALVFTSQLIGLPVVAGLLLGVYYLYRDFARQIRIRQSALLVPQGPADQPDSV
jgi:hypothetical protein